ncbi:nucleic acid-binding protein [Methanosarcinales archaeon]|nr:MAG: nucleic acid-binding protein [Methanosarcinales archaeon]
MAGLELEEIEKEMAAAFKYVLTAEEYKNALLENKLMGLKCDDCGAITCPPMAVCQKCGSKNLKSIELSGKGEIMTFTTITVPPQGFEGPYICCLVKTVEGPWVPGRLNYGVDEAQNDGMSLVGRKVVLEKGVAIPGDDFTVGEHVFPLFKLE